MTNSLAIDRAKLFCALLAVLTVASGCSGMGKADQKLSSNSGVAGAGTGPSTAAALQPVGGGKSGLKGTESTQTEDGPHAGGPH